MVHLITPLTEVAGFHDGDMDGLHAYPGHDRDQNQAEHRGSPDVNPDDPEDACWHKYVQVVLGKVSEYALDSLGAARCWVA